MSKEDMWVASADPAVRVRVYPANSASRAADAKPPALLWMHGGGFVGGSLDMPEGDAVCSRLAASGITCVSVDYRLVPAFGKGRARKTANAVRFPLPLDDCAHAWQWLVDNAPELGVDSARLHVGGASAGGCLAAALALRLTSAGTAPRGVVLAYPFLHPELPAFGPELRHALRGLRRAGTFSASVVKWMAGNYVGRGRRHLLPQAFPGGSDLTGFPPTLIVNSDRDSLRASGEAFAAELRAQGRPVRVCCEAGTAHGHLNKPETPAFERSVATIAAWFDGC
ncbi:alpha/beta hydrolase [Yinghuangia aomiensis]|uniref:Alpha/beta hydrolase n=1 Tax=Yinghuangia aomiensis TaxID=676205 RepID=A0ABP9I7I2_9ACTN